MTDEERPLTEDEYRVWLERRRPEIAELLTAALTQEERDAGFRVEWTGPNEVSLLQPGEHGGEPPVSASR